MAARKRGRNYLIWNPNSSCVHTTFDGDTHGPNLWEVTSKGVIVSCLWSFQNVLSLSKLICLSRDAGDTRTIHVASLSLQLQQ